MPTPEKEMSLVIEKSLTNEDEVERIILDPIFFRDSALKRIVDYQIESASPRHITLYFNHGISVCASGTLEEANKLSIGERSEFVQEMSEEMRNADSIIIGTSFPKLSSF